MDTYYYSEDNKQFGPFTIEELQDKWIKKNTLIWKEGSAGWEEAQDLPELEKIINNQEPVPNPKPAPPALPKQKTKTGYILKRIVLVICLLIGIIFLRQALINLLHPNPYGYAYMKNGYPNKSKYPSEEPVLFLVAFFIFFIVFIFWKNKSLKDKFPFLWKKQQEKNNNGINPKIKIRGRVSNLKTEQISVGNGLNGNIWSFNVVRYDGNDNPLPKIPVQLRGYSVKGFITEGDEVGLFDNWTPPDTLQVTALFNFSNGSLITANRTKNLGCFIIILLVVIMFFIIVIYSAIHSANNH